MTDSEKALELEGTIMSVLPGTMFRVALFTGSDMARRFYFEPPQRRPNRRPAPV
jgi:hypothetical protein